MAISSPLLETSINGAKGVLINVTGSMDIGLEEVETAATLVQEAAHPDVNLIFGASFDENLEDEIRVTVIATGFDEDEKPAAARPVMKIAAAAAPASAAPAQNEAPAAEAGNEPVPAEEVKAAPAPEKASPVSDDDWDILEKIFSRKH